MKITIWNIAWSRDGSVDCSAHATEAAMQEQFWEVLEQDLDEDAVEYLKDVHGAAIDEAYDEACNDHLLEYALSWGPEEIEIPDLALAPAKPVRVGVTVEGGMIQSTWTDSETPIDFYSIDYDTDGIDNAELTDVVQDDGDTAQAVVGKERVASIAACDHFFNQIDKAQEG